MASNTVIFSSHSLAEFFALLFYVGVAIAFLAAWWSIAKKAGFSPRWIALPAAATGLEIVLFALLFFDSQSHTFGSVTISTPSTPAQFSALVYVDAALYLASIVLFFVFACVRWPVEDEARRAHQAWRDERARRIAVQAERAAAASAAGFVASSLAAATATVAAPVLQAPPEPAGGPTTFYCSWCGKQRRSDALTIHHCGSRDRRPLFCSGCGRGLERDDEFCAACGTPASRLSPGG